MECRETQTLLTAFHDGELPAADRASLEEHLRGCPDCTARLADLARVDRAAGVPDPGPVYWERFNARVMERVEREADGPKVAVLRPKSGWMRQQLRYLLPAAAAAALVVVIVRLGGMDSGAPVPALPPAISEPAAPGMGGERSAKAGPGSDGQGSFGSGAGKVAAGTTAPALPAEKADSGAVARPVPPPVLTGEQLASVKREERDRPADRSLPAGVEDSSRDRVPASAARSVPSPPPLTKYRQTPADAPPSPPEDGMPRGMWAERKKMAEDSAPMADRQGAGKAKSAAGMRMANDLSTEAPSAASVGETRSKAGPSALASASPCELAHTLAGLERFREAEVAQRECLAGDLPSPVRERSLVFLAELLDRQARFADADAVIAEVDRQYPQSRAMDLYRQRRSMVQKEPKTTPVTR